MADAGTRAAVPGFVGGSHTLRSRDVAIERTVNFLVESTAPAAATAPRYLLGTPGVRPFATIPGAGSIRGLFAQDGRCWVVGGGTHAELFADGSLDHQFPIVEDAHPATIISNGEGGEQILSMSGGTGIVVDLLTNTQTPISAPALVLPYSTCAFMDGYGIVLKANSPQFNISNREDFSVFDPLDVAQRSEGSDNLVAMVRHHRELLMLGSLTSEIWFDNGDLFPFAPVQGVFLEHGCVATYSAVGVDNTAYWLGANIHGQGIVFRLNGYTPERVSNPAVELALSRSTNLSAAIAWALQMEGHTWYVLYVPDLDTTWTYDVGEQVWCEWARWRVATSQWLPWFGRCHAAAFGTHLVGDRSSGTIYEVSFDLLDNQVAA